MQRRLDRERNARKAAEALLTDKSRALYTALQAAREAERRLQLALWASGEGIWEWDVDARRVAVQGLQLDGQLALDLPQRAGALLRRIHPDDRALIIHETLRHARGDVDQVAVDVRARWQDGWRWLRLRGRALQRSAAGLAQRVTGTVKDVTDQHDADDARHLLAHAFSSALDALVVVDGHWRIVQANAAFAATLRCTAAHLVGQRLTDLVALPPLVEVLPSWRGEGLLMREGDDRVLEVSVSRVAEPRTQRLASPARTADQRHIVALRDVTERLRAQQALAHMAHNDSLTGLANRVAINQHLAERVHRLAAPPFGLMFLDLDGFKAVNDLFGHRAGDEVLLGVADRLRQVLPGQFIGRWGGDEFVVALNDGSDDYLVRESAQLIIAAIGQPFAVGVDSVTVTPSIGAVFFPADGTEAPVLMRRADAAMYAAKNRGRNGLVMYDPALDDGAQRRSRLQGLLRADAERNAFHFVLQPKVDARGQTTGAELLMRWTTEAFGPVSPAEFIPLAEQIGVIDLMGRQALHAAARTAAELRALGSQATVAVNLSPQQLLRPDLERIVMRACETHKADPSQLELELTESALVADPRQARRLLVRLRAHGFQLALDDFGTGYSSLSHLRDLPFHKVKIDRSFVQDLENDPRARLMLEGVVQLCSRLGLGTVAEGVETATQFALLRDVGIQEFQGYYFARPQAKQAWFDSLRSQLPPR